MSIAQAANLVRAQGRNGDTELMHVTPGEVQALQGLAQMHGGSLTRNPETGLPEASFLQSVLPALAGVGIGFATGNPLLGAAVAGGLGYGTSGSLEKGLLSGIGAFGGASALTSLAGVGAAGAAGAGAAGAGAGAGSVGATAAGTSIGSTAVGAGTGIGGSTIPTVAQLGTQATGQLAPTTLSGLTSTGGGLGPTLQAAQAGTMQGGAAALTPAQQFANLSMGDRFGALGQGFSNLFSDPSGTFSAMGGLKGQGLNLGMAATPFLAGAMDQQGPATPPPQESLIRPQVYDPVTQQYTALEPVRSDEWGSRSFDDYRRQFGFQEGGQVIQRYERPTRVMDPAVQEYNQILMNQAQQEYVQQQPMTNVPQLTPSLMAPTPAQTPAAPAQAPATQKFIFDPVSQSYSENPAFTAQKDRMAELERQVQDMSGQLNQYTRQYDNVGAKAGGIIRLAQGGITEVPAFQAGGDMQSDSFVVPADVVSALGNGSTDAGVEVLNRYLGMALPIEGPGDGLSDDIPATIDGEQPARVADGEVYVPPEVVARLGDGDMERGAAKLYAMMDQIRERAHGSTEQQQQVNPEEVMPG